MLSSFNFLLFSSFSGFSFLATFFLTQAFRRYALKKNNLMDVPNERSSHTKPVPRGAGLSIVVVTSCLFVLLFNSGYLPEYYLLAFLSGGVISAVIGMYDDIREAHPFAKLFLHFLAATAAVSFLPDLPTVQFGTLGFELWSADAGVANIAGGVLVIIGLVWMLNLYNFMDGIDGLAGMEATTVSIGAAIILFALGELEWGWIVTSFALAVMGFLVLNWPPAKVFMGDVGSGFLGMTFGLFAIVTAVETEISIWSWLILLSYFISDATITLIRRVNRGEKFYQAHCTHAYQILARRYGDHQKVTVRILLWNVFALFPLAFVASYFPVSGAPVFLSLFGLQMLVCYRVGAGTPVEK